MEVVTPTQAYKHSLSGWDNINSNRLDVIGHIKKLFEEAIGVFRFRMKQSFSPFFWIEFILTIPKLILSYLNIQAPDTLVKVIQIIYWVLMVLIGLHSAQIFSVF